MVPWTQQPGVCPPERISSGKGGPTIAIKLVIENLSSTTTESDLVALFSGVSRVRDVHIPTDRATGEPQGYAFLAVATQAGADRAMQRLDGYKLEGSAIQVREADRASIQIRGAKGGLWGEGHAGSRPKGSRRGARGRKRAL